MTVSLCSTSNVQEKTQLSRSRCMHSLREVKKQFKFLSETLQDFGTMPIFKRTFSQDMDLLEQHLTKDILSQTDCKTTLKNLKTKFENAFNSEFKERMHKFTRFDAQSFKDAMICTMDSVRKYMLEIILHQQRTPHLLKQKKLMQTQEDHSNPIRALNVDSLKVDSVVIQTLVQRQKTTRNLLNTLESRLNTSEIHYSNTWVMSRSPLLKEHVIKDNIIEGGTESEVQDDNSRLGNDTDADDADIIPIYNEEPMAKTTSLLANNAALKAQILEKVFAIAALKNDLRKLKGNSVDIKFANTSVLGKPVVQLLRNQSVVRQPNAFKNKRPQMSKQRFASQVDGNHNLSKPVTQHYLPKKSESAFAKPDHMIASSSSRNSSKNILRFSSNDMVHNHYLDKAKKKTQKRDRNSKTSVMTPARFQSIADDSKPKPRNTNHSSRSLPISKSSCVTITAMPKADHSKSPSSFSDPTRFFCSTCTSINVSKEQSVDVSAEVPSTDTIVMTSMIELESLFDPSFDEYFDGENQVVSKPSVVTTADTSDKCQQPDLTSSTSSLATTVSADGNFDMYIFFILHSF
uniref:Integrase, catalytic region, zinc finger, CCHC-type, peptidase aspartic, catalytic n=1 Tax=Tanacetum cinerariifolium TaxID=118510 RepID=A0A6L2K3A8_TANCI|nr:hypothetical protein [Tanacetum cinerariifolium]